MNDRDWWKKRRRGPRGGCASLGLGLLLAARLAACDPPPAPPAPAPAPRPPPPEVEIPAQLPLPPTPGGRTRCLVGAPGRVQVDGPGVPGPGGPVDALLAHPQGRVRPDLQGRVGLPLQALIGALPENGAVRVTACDGAELVLTADRLSPYDAVVLVDDRAGGLDLVDSREAEPLLRGVSWLSRR
ncbi:MAG: hypothetical protein JNM72_11250 [Deltaproteobacteria bacterium]|nr:hypothetical protein [Deltaproteobacteria bacterium]